jgi:hypothetical protein
MGLAAHGLAPINATRPLILAAQRHSDDMVRRHYSHTVSPSGRTVSERARRAGYRSRRLGENIGWGSGSSGPAGDRRVVADDYTGSISGGRAAALAVPSASSSTYTFSMSRRRSGRLVVSQIVSPMPMTVHASATQLAAFTG